MEGKDSYAAYITAIAGMESALSNAQADVNRAQRDMQQKLAAAEKQETERLALLDSNTQKFEKAYAAVADTLAKPENAALEVNIPRRIRPVTSRQSLQTLALEQKRIIEGITTEINEFRRSQDQEAARQRAQAALRAREAKRAAEALAARRAALNQKPVEPPSKEKPPIMMLAIAGTVVLLVLIALLKVCF